MNDATKTIQTAIQFLFTILLPSLDSAHSHTTLSDSLGGEQTSCKIKNNNDELYEYSFKKNITKNKTKKIIFNNVSLIKINSAYIVYLISLLHVIKIGKQ